MLTIGEQRKTDNTISLVMWGKPFQNGPTCTTDDMGLGYSVCNGGCGDKSRSEILITMAFTLLYYIEKGLDFGSHYDKEGDTAQ